MKEELILKMVQQMIPEKIGQLMNLESPSQSLGFNGAREPLLLLGALQRRQSLTGTQG